jgi:hypothetical protein
VAGRKLKRRLKLINWIEEKKKGETEKKKWRHGFDD